MEIRLEELSLNYAEEFYSWIEDKEALTYTLSAFLPKRDREWVKSFIHTVVNDKNSWNQVILADEKAVGYCGLSNLSRQNHSAEFYIIIGNRTYWKRGIGQIVGKKILRHAFLSLNLHRVWLSLSAHNTSALHLYTKLGFIQEGIMRDGFFRNSEYHDKLIMSVLKNEWESVRVL